jgi:hypothetical protein
MQGISRLAEDLSASQDGLCSMGIISQLIIVSELTKHTVSSKNTGHAFFTTDSDIKVKKRIFMNSIGTFRTPTAVILAVYVPIDVYLDTSEEHKIT